MKSITKNLILDKNKNAMLRMLLIHKIFRILGKNKLIFAKNTKNKRKRKNILGLCVSLVRSNTEQIVRYKNRAQKKQKLLRNSKKFLLLDRSVRSRSWSVPHPFIFIKFSKVYFFLGRRIFFQKKLQTEQKIHKLFCSVFGLGVARAQKLCALFGFPRAMQFFKSTPAKMLFVINFIKKNFILDRLLRKLVIANFEKKKKINTYKAVRIFQNLPSRGQRTKTNAKTAKSRYAIKRLSSKSLNFISKVPKPVVLEKKKTLVSTKKKK